MIGLLIILGSLFHLDGYAQYDPSYAQFFDMETAYNPAAVGKTPKLNFTAAYALDMAGFEHNPRTMYASADMPLAFLRHSHGVGLSFINDEIGLFTHQRLALQYAFKYRLLGGTMSMGLQIGLLNEGFDGSKVDVEDSGDPVFATSDVNGNGMDLSLGLYYLHRDWYVGLSASHVNSPKIEMGETSELQIDPTYYFTGGYNIQLRNPFLKVKPAVLVRYDGEAWRGDVNCRLVYTHKQKMMYGGATYSPDHSVTFLLGGAFRGLRLGYSYELYTSTLNPGNGSHSFCVGYQTDIDFSKKTKNKHQSVRIL